MRMNDISLYENVDLEKHKFPIKIIRSIVRSENLVPHWHEHIELMFFTYGICNMTCGTDSFTAKKDDLVFVNSNQIHFFNKGSNLEYTTLIINHEIFKNIDNGDICIKNLISSDENIKRIFKAINEEYSEKQKKYKLSIMGYAYELITYLLRNYSQSDEQSNRITENEIIAKRTSDILSYISTNYADKLTTAELAKKWYVSECHFCKIFKKITGMSPMNYINRIRIEKSSTLLKNTCESISNIAVKVGFDDVNYFSRTFKKYMNMCPTEYRNTK